jgi:cellulose synthase/poly-beta-1,6-N-acetylglucosamine synthase-like glycosyltransferase
LVCFTDDDCRPVPGWLAALLARHEATGADLVQGRTEPDPEQLQRWGPFTRGIPVVPSENGFYETCNILYRREALELLGGFDEAFAVPYGEDCDLAWRAKNKGMSTAFAEDALVRHEVWHSDVRALFRSLDRSQGLVQVAKLHPHIRDYGGGKVFFRPVHFAAALLAGSCVGVALGRRWRPAWLLLGIGLMKYWHECRSARQHSQISQAMWFLSMPVTLLADLYELAVMAKASYRYRTLLL